MEGIEEAKKQPTDTELGWMSTKEAAAYLGITHPHSSRVAARASDRLAGRLRLVSEQGVTPGHGESVSVVGSGALPSGTLTVLLLDIEGSTRLWEEPRDEPSLLACHDDVLQAALESGDGHVVKSTGDGIIAVFAGAAAAVEAATEAQATLGKEGLPPVRMARRAGDVVERDGDDFGPTLNWATRLMGIGGDFLDLGPHRMRDLSQSEQVCQLLAPSLPSHFPPLRPLDTFPMNPPVKPTSFLAPDDELVAVTELVQRSRIVTVIGVGGVGNETERLDVPAALEMPIGWMDEERTRPGGASVT